MQPNAPPEEANAEFWQDVTNVAARVLLFVSYSAAATLPPPENDPGSLHSLVRRDGARMLASSQSATMLAHGRLAKKRLQGADKDLKQSLLNPQPSPAGGAAATSSDDAYDYTSSPRPDGAAGCAEYQAMDDFEHEDGGGEGGEGGFNGGPDLDSLGFRERKAEIERVIGTVQRLLRAACILSLLAWSLLFHTALSVPLFFAAYVFTYLRSGSMCKAAPYVLAYCLCYLLAQYLTDCELQRLPVIDDGAEGKGKKLFDLGLRPLDRFGVRLLFQCALAVPLALAARAVSGALVLMVLMDKVKDAVSTVVTAGEDIVSMGEAAVVGAIRLVEDRYGLLLICCSESSRPRSNC